MMGAQLHATFALANRGAIENEIERLIELLDACDGDPDGEDDDPALDPLDAGEEDQSRMLPVPIYGLDQSGGPVNEAAALRAWHLDQHARGWPD